MIAEMKILDPRVEIHYATADSAAFDLCAARYKGLVFDGTLPGDDLPVRIWPHETVEIGTGIAVHLPPGTAGLILSRSGHGSRGLNPRNKVGLIDSDYQGEIIVMLHNESEESQFIKPMERIAQFLVVPVVRLGFLPVVEFTEATARGAGGFGSTGA